MNHSSAKNIKELIFRLKNNELFIDFRQFENVELFYFKHKESEILKLLNTRTLSHHSCGGGNKKSIGETNNKCERVCIERIHFGSVCSNELLLNINNLKFLSIKLENSLIESFIDYLKNDYLNSLTIKFGRNCDFNQIQKVFKILNNLQNIISLSINDTSYSHSASSSSSASTFPSSSQSSASHSSLNSSASHSSLHSSASHSSLHSSASHSSLHSSASHSSLHSSASHSSLHSSASHSSLHSSASHSSLHSSASHSSLHSSASHSSLHSSASHSSLDEEDINSVAIRLEYGIEGLIAELLTINENLKYLEYRKNHKRANLGEIALSISNSLTIRHLILSEMELDESAAINIISSIGKNQSLKELDISGCSFDIEMQSQGPRIFNAIKTSLANNSTLEILEIFPVDNMEYESERLAFVPLACLHDNLQHLDHTIDPNITNGFDILSEQYLENRAKQKKYNTEIKSYIKLKRSLYLFRSRCHPALAEKILKSACPLNFIKPKDLVEINNLLSNHKLIGLQSIFKFSYLEFLRLALNKIIMHQKEIKMIQDAIMSPVSNNTFRRFIDPEMLIMPWADSEYDSVSDNDTSDFSDFD